MSVVKEETINPKEVLGTLENLKEFTANELSNDLPPIQNKFQKIKSFNIGDGVKFFKGRGD